MTYIARLWFTTLALTGGCAAQVADSDLPLELAEAAAKADGFSECAQDHASSADITVLSARTLGRAAPSSNTVPADFNVDCSRCDVLASAESTQSDCTSYELCRDETLDCSGALESAVGMPFIGEARFDVWHAQTSGDPRRGRPASDRYYDESFNCQVLEITTASRTAALPTASAIGFYYDHHLSYVSVDQLEPVGEVTLANGEPGTLHRFGALTMCWAGSFSSSLGGVTEFKPFVLFEGDDGVCYYNWDQVPSNYRITSGVKSFDRRGEVLAR